MQTTPHFAIQADSTDGIRILTIAAHTVEDALAKAKEWVTRHFTIPAEFHRHFDGETVTELPIPPINLKGAQAHVALTKYSVLRQGEYPLRNPEHVAQFNAGKAVFVSGYRQ